MKYYQSYNYKNKRNTYMKTKSCSKVEWIGTIRVISTNRTMDFYSLVRCIKILCIENKI